MLLKDELSRCATSSRCVTVPVQNYDWIARRERLVHNHDNKRVWVAIDWRGEYIENKNAEVGSSSEAFRVHCDEIYNPAASTALDPNQCQSDVQCNETDE